MPLMPSQIPWKGYGQYIVKYIDARKKVHQKLFNYEFHVILCFLDFLSFIRFYRLFVRIVRLSALSITSVELAAPFHFRFH